MAPRIPAAVLSIHGAPTGLGPGRSLIMASPASDRTAVDR
jgi:hypothetical protein